jgi:hypothetical protein
MTIDDKQLDAWLREVAIPGDLAERLMSLPGREPPTRESRGRLDLVVGAALALAATIAGVAVFVRGMERAKRLEVAAPTPGGERVDATPSVELVKARGDLAAIDEALSQLEVRALSEKLATFASDASTEALAPLDRASLIVCLSDQSALQLGGSRESVERDMARVIEKFPSTAGAANARIFLADNKIQ